MQDELQIQYWIERVALFNDQAAYEKILRLRQRFYTLQAGQRRRVQTAA